MLAAAADARAEVRTATLNDGVDPTVGFDIAQVQVAFDPDAGRATVVTRLHAPMASDDRSSFGGITMSANLYGRTCSPLAKDAVGDTSISIGRDSLSGQFEATGSVNYRQEHPEFPVTVSADRREFTVEVQDELLVGANLRCLGASGYGRGTYDPRQPSGGPTYDDADEVFFDGFDPSDPRNKVFSLSYRLQTPQRLSQVRGYRNMIGHVSCTIRCRVKIDGYARVPRRGGGWRRIPRLSQGGSFSLNDGAKERIGFNIVRRERRILDALFTRYRWVQFVLTMHGTDVIGRTKSVTRKMKLLPPKPKPPPKPRQRPPADCQGYRPCLSSGADVDCAGGSGNGPRYATGPVYVTGADPYGLDADGDGVACE